MSLQLPIEYPETFPDALGPTRDQFEQAAKWAMAVKLFELKHLLSGMAATLLGVSRTTCLLVKLFELKHLLSGMAATLLGVRRTTCLLRLGD